MSDKHNIALGTVSRRRFRAFDVFMSVNAAALVGSTLYAYASAEWEFGLYAAVILAAGALVWKVLRRYDYPIWMLALLQLAVIAHFAGGFVRIQPDGHSLYWHPVLGIRFDRIVHMANSAVGAIVIAHIFRQARLKLQPMAGFIVIMTVCGIGAGIEIIEYFAVRVIENTGVGDYANTVEDLIMNAIGAAGGWAIVRIVFAMRGRPLEIT